MKFILGLLVVLTLALALGKIARAAEPVVFRPTYAPAPVDNPLKGFVPCAGQGRKFPHSLEDFDTENAAPFLSP